MSYWVQVYSSIESDTTSVLEEEGSGFERSRRGCAGGLGVSVYEGERSLMGFIEGGARLITMMTTSVPCLL